VRAWQDHAVVTTLHGGTQVSGLSDGSPWQRGSVRGWDRVGRSSGAVAISLRILEFAAGRSPGLQARACDEVLYALAGAGRVFVDGHGVDLGQDCGVFVAEGRSWAIDNPGPAPLLLASSRCPEPAEDRAAEALPAGMFAPLAGARAPQPGPVAALCDQPRRSTGDRWYCELLDERLGCRRVTQFVGAIPPGRAPDHLHPYEEVIVIRQGHGVLWSGDSQAPIGPGSCIFLPARQVHCLQNEGPGPMTLLGVFHPAGSPAVRYEPGP